MTSFFQFDASTVEPQKPMDKTPVPAGTYLAQIIESEVKPLKSGNGTGMALTFEILDKAFAKRRIWTNLNVQHTNPVAQQIGQQQLSSICRAVNVIRMTETSQLHNRPLKIRVKIRKDEQYGDKNEVTDYESAGNAIGAAPMPSAATAPTAPAANAAPLAPWAKPAAA
jgi:hypothetical protein